MNCPICNSSQTRTKKYPQLSAHPSLQLRNIQECENCDFAWALPQYTQSDLDQFYMAGDYWENGGVSATVINHHKVQAELRLKNLLPHIEARKGQLRCLDIGAGQGFIGHWMKRLHQGNVIYEAFEGDPSARENIIKNQPDNNAQFVDLFKLEPDKKYDVIFACHVMEHVADPKDFVERIKKHLHSDGVAYIEVPNRDDLIKTSVFPHTLFFSRESICALEKKIALQTLQLETFGDSVTAAGQPGIRKKVISKLYDFSVKTSLWGLQRFLNHRLFDYNLANDGLWLRWVFKHS